MTKPIFFDDFVWIPDGPDSACGTIKGGVIQGFQRGTLVGRKVYTQPAVESMSDIRLFETAMTAEEIAAEYEAFVRLGDDWMIEGEVVRDDETQAEAN